MFVDSRKFKVKRKFKEDIEPEIDVEQYIMEIKELAYNDYQFDLALSKCKKLDFERDRDSCYIEIVDASKQKDVCEKIVSDYRRDVCYVSFVMQGDYSVCDNILDFDLRQSCETLKESSIISS